MSVIWRKVRRDLWGSKFRTFLIILATAVGLFAVGVVFGTSDVLRTRMAEDHQSGIPAHVTLYTSQFKQDILETILDQPGIADAEGETWTSIRWKSESETETEWHDGILVARADFDAQRMNLVNLVRGEWPDKSDSKRVLTVERMTSQHYDVPFGATILVESGRSNRRLPVEGVARFRQAPPPQLVDLGTFFASQATIDWLTGEGEGFDRLNLRLESFSEERANEVGERIQDRLRRMGLGVGGYGITDPDIHGAQETFDSLLLILAVLGALSLALSAFLIINMMNATVAQQIWQIGVMKVVGATRSRVVGVYLTMAATYGLIALALAVLPSALGAHLLASALLGLLNVDVGPFRVMPEPLTLQIGVGVVVPLVAALVPVLSGARITPREAISNYGLGAGFGSNWLDRLIGGIRRLPRPLALSLRNTFRRKARITLTMITLVLGGVMFIGVLSVGASMSKTLEVLLGDLGFDVLVGFDRLYRVPRMVEVAKSAPGVARAEVWDQRGANLSLESGEEREVFLWGVPGETEMFSPRIVDGRGLLPGDNRAILLNSKIAADEDIQVSDDVELTIGERESTWTVVGLILNVNNQQRDNFVPYDALARATGNINRGSFMMVMSDEEASVTQQDLMRDLREACTARGMKPAGLQSADEVRQMNRTQFDMITYLMLAMAVLAAVVGSVGLMSTMSISVVERRREIGVMRAIGAQSAGVLGIFVIEGVLIGLLAWVVAAPLSYPGARALNDLVSTKLFQVPLDFQFSMPGVVLWLAIAVVLSALASLWPAMNATQVSVREALAYE